MVYDKRPSVTTGDCHNFPEGIASVSCQYENCIFWGGYCGIEYGCDGNFEKLIVFPRDDDNMSVNLTELTANRVYKYRAYYEINGQTIYGEYKSFMTGCCPDDNHPHMIDLGLPSGTKWACCNLGASKPEDFGIFYEWGGSRPYDGNLENYRDNFGYIDIGRNIQSTHYDTASLEWGSQWQMPTVEQIKELFSCRWWEITSHQGSWIEGVKLIPQNSEINVVNGVLSEPVATLYLPLYNFNGDHYLYFWSSEKLYDNEAHIAEIKLYYDKGVHFSTAITDRSRYVSSHIRPVAK